jgi:hypothetical protein
MEDAYEVAGDEEMKGQCSRLKPDVTNINHVQGGF